MRYLMPISVLVAVLGSSAMALEESYFSCVEPPEPGNTISLGLVRAGGDGVVEVYDYRTGSMGEKLAEVAVHQGANADVMVHSMETISHDILAQLVVDGEVVASQVYTVCADD